MEGFKVIKDQELLSKIQAHYPLGIFSAQDFLRRIEVGDEIFEVTASETGQVWVEEYPSLFLGMHEYEGPVAECKGMKQYHFKRRITETRGFVEDLFRGCKACFFFKEDALHYAKQIREQQKVLFTDV